MWNVGDGMLIFFFRPTYSCLHWQRNLVLVKNAVFVAGLQLSYVKKIIAPMNEVMYVVVFWKMVDVLHLKIL